MKHLASRVERLARVNLDYNSVTYCPDLTGLRHKPFVAGAGTTDRPAIMFLGLSPSPCPSSRGSSSENQGGGQRSIRTSPEYKVVEALCNTVGIEDYYMTYLFKYELNPGHRLTRSEITQALLYLREEISILQPQGIVLLGTAVTEVMFPDYNKRGEELINRVVYGSRATYYPVHDLKIARRNENALLDMRDDIASIAVLVETISQTTR